MLGRERVDAFCDPSGPLLPWQDQRDSFRPLKRSTNQGDAMNKFYMAVVVVLAAALSVVVKVVYNISLVVLLLPNFHFQIKRKQHIKNNNQNIIRNNIDKMRIPVDSSSLLLSLLFVS